MADRLTPEQRRLNMAAVKGQDTRPEIIVRRLLHKLGYRYLLHDRRLPGKPDIVLPKFRTIIWCMVAFGICTDALGQKFRRRAGISGLQSWKEIERAT